MDGVEGQWDVELTPDKQHVMVRLSHMGEDGVESFTTDMDRESAIAMASDILNAALDICICGECDA